MLRNSWSSGGRDELFDVIRRVRNRWRTRVVLRGTAVVAAAGLAAFLLSSYGLEFFKFSAGAVIAPTTPTTAPWIGRSSGMSNASPSGASATMTISPT